MATEKSQNKILLSSLSPSAGEASCQEEPYQPHCRQHRQDRRPAGTVGSRLTAAATRRFSTHADGIWDIDAVETNEMVPLGKNCRQLIGTASADRTARVYADDGQCLVEYTGHGGSVNSIRFRSQSDDHMTALTASGDCSAHVWNLTIECDKWTKTRMTSSPILRIGAPRRQLSGHRAVVMAADWLSNGGVITASWDRTAKVHDVERGHVVCNLNGHTDELTHCSGHVTETLALTSSKDATYRLWDWRSSQTEVAVCKGHNQSVNCAIFATNLATNDVIISGSDDKTACVWDLRNLPTPITTMSTDSPINRLSTSGTLCLIALPHDNGSISLYDLNASRVSRLTKQGHSRIVCATKWGHVSKDQAAQECNQSTASLSVNLYTCSFDRRVLSWTVNSDRSCTGSG